MKLFFSEYKSDYAHYIFPYAIWAFPEEHETPTDFFARGFLPNSPNLDRFYLCRNIRINLSQYVPSSENRRILRKGEGIKPRLVERKNFDFSPVWREFCKKYADEKFGQDVMSYERLDNLMDAPIISHVIIFNDIQTRKDVGLVFLYIDEPNVAFYYYSFYDLTFVRNSLGMYMMTAAVGEMKNMGIRHIYLGSCYSRNALYKTQFDGVEFFNGFRWSNNIKELKYLIDRDKNEVDRHLLESNDFLNEFYPDGILPGKNIQGEK